MLLQTATAAPASPLAQQAAAVLEVLAGRATPSDVFAPALLSQVPVAQLNAVAAQLRTQHGNPIRVEPITPLGPSSAQVDFRYERAIVHAVLAIEPEAPHRVIGLRITGTTATPLDDSLDKLRADLMALHGHVAATVIPLDDPGAPAPLSVNANQRLALGSAFKLYVLAELVRQTEAGERHWTDVVTLEQASLPSGVLQTWPHGSPVTLHTLAALMISQSDNTAADILIQTLGRDKIEAVQTSTGHEAPQVNRPFLTTREMFVLKGTAHDGLARQWLGADEAGRRAMLPQLDAVPTGRIDAALLAAAPFAIDTIEWFASPAEVASVFDWLRRHTEDGPGSPARALLAINPGLPATASSALAYVGFKGGSEPGVVTLNYLVENRASHWYAVSFEWNDGTQAVDTAALVGLASRAIALLPQ
jgi:beta-lactamase class A